MPDELLERPTGQRADRIEGDVAEQLHPDFMTNARRHARAQAGGDERVGERPDALRPRPIRFAQGEAIPFGMVDDAGLGDVGREIRERADDTLRLDRLRDRAARVHVLEVQAVQIARVVLEVPPGDAVLRADDRGAGIQQRPELRRQRGDAVRLYAENDDVRPADRVQIAGYLRLDLEVAVGTHNPEPAFVHRPQVRSAREQHDVGARPGEARADVSADGAGSDDRNPHGTCCV